MVTAPTTGGLAVTTRSDLEKLGLRPPERTTKRRLVTLVWAREKKGKTHFSLTGSEPIVYIDINFGSEGVVDKFLSKNVLAHTVNYDKDGGNAALWKAEWEKLKAVANAAWGLKEQGTVILDTWTEVYELIRLARFGTLDKVMPNKYGPVFSELRGMLNNAFKSEMSTILIAKLAPVYENNERTNRYEPKGWSDTPFEVQLNVEMDRKDFRSGGGCEFTAKIADCRYAPSMNGQKFSGPMCDFEIVRDAVIAANEAEIAEMEGK